MITSLRMMWNCHWSARRIQRYLDADRGVPLTHVETRRLEQHLAVCQRCEALAEEHRVLRRLLAHLAGRDRPDPSSVSRLRHTLDELVAGDPQ